MLSIGLSIERSVRAASLATPPTHGGSFNRQLDIFHVSALVAVDNPGHQSLPKKSCREHFSYARQATPFSSVARQQNANRMTPQSQSRSSRLRLAALAVVLVLNVASSLYPFVFELMQRVTNTAKRQPDGTWDLDSSSRVTGHVPESAAALMATGQFRLTVEARPGLPNQSGPARLFAVGRSPYDASFMVGIERDEVVLRLPCSGPSTGIDAEWRMPLQGWQEVAVSASFESSANGLLPLIQVGVGPKVQLKNNCPQGSAPRLPDLEANWTLGNVNTGHRPFVGRIVKLELDRGGLHVDLLRDTNWQAPASFWIWPERLHQPANDDVLAATWHFVSFVPLGYLVGTAVPSIGYPRVLTGILAFSATLNGGKLLIAGRHASLVDSLLNLAGAVAGIAAFRWSKRTGTGLRLT